MKAIEKKYAKSLNTERTSDVATLTKKYARDYLDKFRRPYDPDESDWDCYAWDNLLDELPYILKGPAYEKGWDVFTAILEKETKMLARAI